MLKTVARNKTLIKPKSLLQQKRNGSSQPIISRNPTTGKELKRYEFMNSSQVAATVEKSYSAYKQLRDSSFNDRKQFILRVSQKLMENKERYGKMITTEMGKPITAAYQEIEKCAGTCVWFAENAENLLKEEIVQSDATTTRIVYDPLGPVLQIPPFNFPFWQVIRFAIPAIMAGNPVIIRHSHSIPQCAELLDECFKAANVPEGVYINVYADNDAVKKMIEDMRIRGVAFTGSTQTGRIIAEESARNLKKHVLELGGSDPFIVLKDADIDAAVQNAVIGRCLNNGQNCIGSKRFLVEAPVLEEFTQKFVAAFGNLKEGDPMDPTVNIGPLARKDLRDQLAAQVEQSVKQGAKILCGGFVPKSDGFFYAPTILGNVKRGNIAAEEELFGPAAAIMSCKDENEALEIANSSQYGLGGSIHTRDVEKGERLARKLESGLAFVNGVTKSAPQYPFGGVKNSGYGRECGEAGIKEWTNMKTIWIK